MVALRGLEIDARVGGLEGGGGKRREEEEGAPTSIDWWNWLKLPAGVWMLLIWLDCAIESMRCCGGAVLIVTRFVVGGVGGVGVGVHSWHKIKFKLKQSAPVAKFKLMSISSWFIRRNVSIRICCCWWCCCCCCCLLLFVVEVVKCNFNATLMPPGCAGGSHRFDQFNSLLASRFILLSGG